MAVDVEAGSPNNEIVLKKINDRELNYGSSNGRIYSVCQIQSKCKEIKQGSGTDRLTRCGIFTTEIN